MVLKMEKLEQQLKKIIEIDNDLKKRIQNEEFFSDIEQFKEFMHKVKQFRKIKLEIQKQFLHHNTIKLKDNILRKILQDISSGKDFYADIVVKILYKELSKDNDDQLCEQEIWDLSFESLFSWFGPREYIEGLIEIGVVAINTKIPKILSDYLEDARKCYAFQQYNAVNALARVILEIAIRDICIRKKLIQEINDPKEFYKKYPPKTLIRLVANGDLKSKIEDLYYDRLSPLIHGFRSFSSKKVSIELKDTMQLIEKLYEYNNINT